MSKKTLRQRVTTYFRQLSFINEPRVPIPISNRRTGDENIIRKFLEGRIPEREPCPSIQSGRDPEDMPEVELRIQSFKAMASTGPDQGIQSVARTKLHLSAGSDIDFIDNNNLDSDFEVRRSKRANAQRFGGIVSGPCASRLQVTSATNKKERGSPEEHDVAVSLNTSDLKDNQDFIAGIQNWSSDCDYACGMSTSLYERNPITQELTGSPIADCYAVISRNDSCILALADGVNWGEKACLAARAAIRGAVEYLDTALFGLTGFSNGRTLSTRNIYVSLMRSLWEGHNCILEVGGALTTLTIAVILPVAGETDNGNEPRRWMVCACNVGDSLGFVYSKQSGIREFTEASHDTTTARDIRDALGALGPVDGTKPELSNLTLSMTKVEEGDIVFLTSDGVSDNFDPVVGKFAIAESETPDMSAIKTQHKVGGKQRQGIPDPHQNRPKLQPINRPPSVSTRPQYNRSRTVIEPKRDHISNAPGVGGSTRAMVAKPTTVLPQLSATQRHQLTLLRMEDLLAYGINGVLQPCNSARRLCKLLIDFSRMITSARRSLLEQRETYVRLVTDAVTGQRRESELNRIQQRAARKRIVDSSTFQSLPGKLDHASVVAFMCRGTSDTDTENISGPSTSQINTNRKIGMPSRSSVIETDF